jgi:hypothetical protein
MGTEPHKGLFHGKTDTFYHLHFSEVKGYLVGFIFLLPPPITLRFFHILGQLV